MSQSKSLQIKQISVESKVISELAFLFTIYILVTSLLFLHFRSWDTDITRQVWGVFVYPAGLFGGVALAWRYVPSVIWVLPISCLLFMGLPFLVAFLGGWSLTLLGLFGIGATIFSYLSTQQQGPLLSKTLQLLGAGIILALIYFLVVNGYNYAHLFSDVAAYTNTLHRDTLFHSAIVEMLAKFNTPSTGLDGVKPLEYHVGVHRWVAANLNILGGQAPLLLAICQQIAFLPVLFFTAALVLSCLVSTQVSTLVACGFTFLALWLSGTRIWDSYLAGESYAFSLPIFMAMLPVGQSWLFKACQSDRWFTVHPMAVTMAVVAVLSCQAAKISSGVMLALFLVLCAFIPKILQKTRLNWRTIWPLVALCCAFFLGCLGLAFAFSGTLPINFYPLHFARICTNQFIWQNLVFLGLIISFYWLSGKEGQLHQGCPPRAKLSQVVMLTIMFFASQVPGFLLEIGGGSAVYFVLPTLFVVLFFTLAAFVDYWQANHKTGLIALLSPVDHLWEPLPRPLIWALITLILVFSLSSGTPEIGSYKARGLGFVRNLVISLDSFYYKSDIDEASSMGVLKRVGGTPGVLKLLFFPPTVKMEILEQKTELGYVKAELRKLGISKTSKNLVIYIAPDFSAFWQPQGNRNCWDKSFVIPAMTGFPLLNGVRADINNCESTKYYGMVNYNSGSWNRLLSSSELCNKATQLGFNQVLSVTETKTQLYSCNLSKKIDK
ncbi:hypothetical protein [Aphanizomenon flos-aquae]|uniref:hypothetical protein n=1 Tax=Aphanizomenon flos-aquae TaxID=1176 RepID=UPI00047FF552|nr:hypothetical protein [Aphanizomenon flos-aquae]